MLSDWLRKLRSWRLAKTIRGIERIADFKDIGDEYFQHDVEQWLKRATKRKSKLERKLGITS
jgi:hypothetical protein